MPLSRSVRRGYMQSRCCDRGVPKLPFAFEVARAEARRFAPTMDRILATISSLRVGLARLSRPQAEAVVPFDDVVPKQRTTSSGREERARAESCHGGARCDQFRLRGQLLGVRLCVCVSG